MNGRHVDGTPNASAAFTPSASLLRALLPAGHGPPTAAQEEMATTLMRLGERRAVGDREVVWEESSSADFFAYVLDGELELRHHGKKIEVLLPGSTMGFLFMLYGDATGGTRATTLVGRQPGGSMLRALSID